MIGKGKNKKARFQLKLKTGFKKIPGSVLLSHPAAQAVPSAQKGLTSVFEMGTGVAPSPLPPGNHKIRCIWTFFNYKNKYGAEEKYL